MKFTANHSIIAMALAATVLVTGSARAQVASATMKITSSAFQEGAVIPARFSRNGQNVNPALRIEGVPENARSLVLILDDPDAPAGLFTHWMVWNIDPKTTDIGEGSTPNGAIQGTNDFPSRGYDGPQPPSGTHRYYFRIFALDTTIKLTAKAQRKNLDDAMKGHVIGQGQLMGRYSKNRSSRGTVGAIALGIAKRLHLSS